MFDAYGEDTRLIERWLPIRALGEECERERRSMTALPPIYYLHVWWARRPLVVCRAAILASILPASADRDKFLHLLGIHGDPVATRQKIDRAKATGDDLGTDPYGYKRAFTYSLDTDDLDLFSREIDTDDPREICVLDPTVGGGSIPLEALRIGITPLANDLNPVAAFIVEATVNWPRLSRIGAVFDGLTQDFIQRAQVGYENVFPPEPRGIEVLGYLWARTIGCPFCDGSVPLSPNWKLTTGGTGIRLKPFLGSGPGSLGRECSFEVVSTAEEQSKGTVARGIATCPYEDCGQVIDGDEIKQQAQAGQMNEQLYAIVFKRQIKYETKSGQTRTKWEKGFRVPQPGDDNSKVITRRLSEKLPEWEALDIVPSERFPTDSNDSRPIEYGMPLWRDLFSSRQLLCHGTSVQIYREMLEEDRKAGRLDDLRKAAYGYLAIALDKLLDYNSLKCTWIPRRQVIGHSFVRHDFAFAWSYAEMAPSVTGTGYKWMTKQIAKCIKELSELVQSDDSNEEGQLYEKAKAPLVPVQVTCKPGDRLDHINTNSVDLVVMDPPYYDNVMYAELSDFFYVWLKRTAGYVFPELFRRTLTDKTNEAVANPIRFKDEKGVKQLAARDYQVRMASIFEECKRVLKSNGLMTLMFNHKATGAWDALTSGLMEAGFVITASWPINTEAPGSSHIRDKAAVKSTIFLTCRPRDTKGSSNETNVYWEDVEELVAKAVRLRIGEFEEAGIDGVDLFLASFGPALEEFSRHWPLTRGTPRPKPGAKQLRIRDALGDDSYDPYAVTPEDALDAARREVKRWRLKQISHDANTELDPTTAFVVFAWDTFKAPTFPFDEGLHLARSVGVDLDKHIVGRLATKSGQNLTLMDSTARAKKGTFGSHSGSTGMIDALHHAAYLARTRSFAVAEDSLVENGLNKDPDFQTALTSLLEVLPPSKRFTNIEIKGDIAAAGDDFEALYDLNRLAFTEKFSEPMQLMRLKQRSLSDVTVEG